MFSFIVSEFYSNFLASFEAFVYFGEFHWILFGAKRALHIAKNLFKSIAMRVSVGGDGGGVDKAE